MAAEWKITGFWMKTLFVFAALAGVWFAFWMTIFFLVFFWGMLP